jgi:hypothetical protein
MPVATNQHSTLLLIYRNMKPTTIATSQYELHNITEGNQFSGQIAVRVGIAVSFPVTSGKQFWK